MKFVVDLMLGNLARWLRMLGYDTLYGIKDDEELIRISKNEKRILITSDRKLARKAENVIFIKNGLSIEEQLLLLKKVINLKIPREPQLRCPNCNFILRKAKKEEINILKEEMEKKKRKWKETKNVYFCERCKKFYWEGSHWKNIKKVLEKLQK
ncbi:MAG: Mut7-C RNAse domain-containing protein [Candidatus Aenigmatarchaeota archaeon]|jgi:uncharacterized protein with PIN domain